MAEPSDLVTGVFVWAFWPENSIKPPVQDSIMAKVIWPVKLFIIGSLKAQKLKTLFLQITLLLQITLKYVN